VSRHSLRTSSDSARTDVCVDLSSTAPSLRLDLAKLSPTLLPLWFTSLLNLLQNVEMDPVSRCRFSVSLNDVTEISPCLLTVALILAPTRELATQILRECRALSRGGEIKSACAYGGTSSHILLLSTGVSSPLLLTVIGVSRTTQMMEIQSGVDILIATPGRLLDFLSAREVTLKRCTYFVLDEADRMVHLGFENEVRQIISMIRPDRQTLMYVLPSVFIACLTHTDAVKRHNLQVQRYFRKSDSRHRSRILSRCRYCSYRSRRTQCLFQH